MTKRLNITLPDDVVARADAFARAERYSRSGLIAAALDSFVSGDTGAANLAREAEATYAPHAVGLNPAVRPLIPAIVEACRHHAVVWVALFGSSTQPDVTVTPRDLDVLVDLGPGIKGRAGRYFSLAHDLERVSGMSVDLVERDAVKNPRLRGEFERTQVVLYETP
jgi:predicted nucleotidyltransferase